MLYLVLLLEPVLLDVTLQKPRLLWTVLSFSRCNNAGRGRNVLLDTVKVYRLQSSSTVWWCLSCKSEETVVRAPMSFLLIVKETLWLVIIYRPWTRSEWWPTVCHSSTVMMSARRPQCLARQWHHTDAKAREVTGSEAGHTDTYWQNNTQHAEATRDWGGRSKEGDKDKLGITWLLYNHTSTGSKICKVKCSWAKINERLCSNLKEEWGKIGYITI